jgi:hypothetical protein
MRHHTAIAAGAALALLAFGATSASAAAPTIIGTAISSPTTSTVTLEAEINPQGKATLYHFEYDTLEYETGEGPHGTSTPTGKIVAGGSAVRVSEPIEGLTPGTAYHFRAVATNGKTVSDATVGPDRAFATHAAPLEGLPDERAYEQVTPVNKDGGDVTGPLTFVKASPGGQGITFLSSTGVPGAEGAQNLALYLASRSEGGWSTQGLLPAADAGQKARVIGWLPDLSETFGMPTRLDDPPGTALLARSSAGGSLTPVVPYTAGATYSFAGSSADGSEVVFESTAKLDTAPAGIEGVSNVYAWDRASGKLSLASVLNEEEAPSPKGSFAGPYDWVRGTTKATLTEGGAARQYYTQDEHAVAADGSVYFTAAGTGQLYLRRNPTAKQSELDENGDCTEAALACTVRISESRKKNGGGPSGTDSAGPAPAAFMAAGTDGSSAIFTSSEMLTNDAKTGPEQAAPAIGRAVAEDGSELKPGFLPQAAIGVAVDGTHIYWANPSKGTIGRAELDGTQANPEFVSDAGAPRYVAVDENHVYWTNAANGKDGEGTIGRAKLGAVEAEEEEPEFIAGKVEIAPGKFENVISNPQGIAVDGTHIYWANAGESNPTRAIGQAGIGGDPESVDRDFIELVFGGEIPQGVALDAGHVYWTVNEDNGFIDSAALGGGEEKSIFLGEGGSKVQGIAVDAGHVYWAARGEGAIGRANLELKEVQHKFIEVEGKLTGAAVDGSHLYWSVNGDTVPNPGNDLYRFNAKAPAGERLTDLTPDPDPADLNGAEVQGVLGASDDGSYVYFAANGDLDGEEGPATAGDCRGRLGSTSGSCNLYLWHEGDGSSFIARLDGGGSSLEAGAANWAATPTGVYKTLAFQKTARVSPDGRTLLFSSERQLGGYDNEGKAELYRYHIGDPGPTCVSCNPTGAPPVGAARLGTIIPTVISPQPPAAVLPRNLAAGGDRVFFETSDALLAGDTNGEAGCPPVGSESQSFAACQDVYEWEAMGSGTCQSASENGGCLYLLSTGKSPEPSFFADASLSAKDAFLFTREGLVGQDKDELIDVYDARVRGGIPSQSKPPSAICEGIEACRPHPSAPPASESPSSAGFSGPPNPRPTRPHRKGKKKHHKKKHHRAHAKPGAGR